MLISYNRTKEEGLERVDGAAEKLLKALRDLEQEQWRIANKIAVVKAALSLAGVEVPATATQ